MSIAALALPFVSVRGGEPEAVPMPTGGLVDYLEHPEAFRHAQQAVVRIDVREIAWEGDSQRLVRGQGSGVIISAEGHVLTNAHVVSPDAVEILVTLANLERVRAKLVGWDHWTDLALLQLDLEEIEEKGLAFAAAQFGTSHTLQPGMPVYALGTPNGLTRTVTRGIISNPQRYFAANNSIRGYETGYFNTWLQTDAAINPGNSGGPLVTPDGKVVGINTRSYLGANNLSFAVPADTAREVIPQLQAGGEVVRSNIGIRPAPLRDLEAFFGLDANVGMLIDSVDAGSPAADAGLRAGDIVLAIDGQAVDGRFAEQLPPILHRIAVQPVGQEVSLKLRRGSEELTVPVTTERLESRVGARGTYADWGLSVQEVSKPLARERRYDNDDGLLVIGLQNAFPAERAGVRVGDIILSANRESLASMDDLRSIYEGYTASPSRVLLEVRRNREIVVMVLKP
ncbi:MAG: trypsin-like peptidase domain-containing protein [Verrucomicrobiota bacterium JB022]|nr:trypsin-like peptidase domain-containing protein [Verrucomicrobiota bacterium JB022]